MFPLRMLFVKPIDPETQHDLTTVAIRESRLPGTKRQAYFFTLPYHSIGGEGRHGHTKGVSHPSRVEPGAIGWEGKG